jgi:hypothetical protein
MFWNETKFKNSIRNLSLLKFCSDKYTPPFQPTFRIFFMKKFNFPVSAKSNQDPEFAWIGIGWEPWIRIRIELKSPARILKQMRIHYKSLGLFERRTVRRIYTNFMQLVPNGPEDRCRGSFFNEYKLTRMFLFSSFYTRIILIDISLIQGIIGSELF